VFKDCYKINKRDAYLSLVFILIEIQTCGIQSRTWMLV